MVCEAGGLVVRVAGGGDVAAIASLRSQWSGAVETNVDFERRMEAWLSAEGDRRTTWLAVSGDVPVGMASLLEYRRMPKPGLADSRWGYVGNMFVRESFRRRGIGSALLGALTATAHERSYVRMVVSPSAGAVSFYRRCGFMLAGDGAGEDALMVLPCPPARSRATAR
jgi:GNAT superfamily N-acetyltransferase